jgi:hypothetical protein
MISRAARGNPVHIRRVASGGGARDRITPAGLDGAGDCSTSLNAQRDMRLVWPKKQSKSSAV